MTIGTFAIALVVTLVSCYAMSYIFGFMALRWILNRIMI
jgi:hypothetical protein